MPKDPAHGRDIPTGRRLAGVLSRWFRSLFRWAVGSIGSVMAGAAAAGSFLSPFALKIPEKLVDTVGDILAVEYGRGWRSARRRRDGVQFREPVGEVPMPTKPPVPIVRVPLPPVEPVTLPAPVSKPLPPKQPPIRPPAPPSSPLPSGVPRPHVQFDFNYVLPEVRENARRYAYDMIRNITDTTRAKVRDIIERGVANGKTVSQVRRELEPLFGARRAQMIAQTEVSRAMHAGQVEAAKRNGAIGVEWLASSDACEQCLPLNGKKIKFGEEFSPGVSHPPLHPNCRCAIADVYEEPI